MKPRMVKAECGECGRTAERPERYPEGFALMVVDGVVRCDPCITAWYADPDRWPAWMRAAN